jgi:hypothetical protein
VHGQRSTIPVLKTNFSKFENLAESPEKLLRNPSIYSESRATLIDRNPLNLENLAAQYVYKREDASPPMTRNTSFYDKPSMDTRQCVVSLLKEDSSNKLILKN